MALIVGGNSFIIVADADLYFADSLLFSSWDALDSTTKPQALITSAGQINLLLSDECRLIPADPNSLVIPDDLASANAELAVPTDDLHGW